MSGLKEIKRRLKSVRNTKKITYAMKLVSAAKLRRAQDAVAAAREYTLELNSLLASLARAAQEVNFEHPLMEPRKEVKSVAILIIGGQRGLCGGYNSNLHKRADALIREISANHPQAAVRTYIFGRKPAEYFRRKARAYDKSWEDLSENALVWPVEEAAGILEGGFVSKDFDEVYMVYTRFKSAISNIPTIEKILPVSREMISESGQSPKSGLGATEQEAGVTLFEPTVKAVYEAIIPRVMSSRVRQACLDAKASETASRMTAMDAATKNASELSRKLELKHNKIRQQRITSELLDIIGGAEAIK